MSSYDTLCLRRDPETGVHQASDPARRQPDPETGVHQASDPETGVHQASDPETGVHQASDPARRQPFLQNCEVNRELSSCILLELSQDPSPTLTGRDRTM
ncbi:unnamed protein product [Gadus morhua 'NCC']